MQKLTSVVYSFRVMRQQVDQGVLYFANFQSRLNYGIIAWGGCSATNQIFVMQKSAIRIVYGLSYRQSCRGLFRMNNILTLAGLYIFRCLLFLHQRRQTYFKQHENTNNTRRTNPLHFPMHSLTLTEKNVEYMSITFFNKIPKEIQIIDRFNIFKSRLHRLLIDIEPYTVQEFLAT